MLWRLDESNISPRNLFLVSYDDTLKEKKDPPLNKPLIIYYSRNLEVEFGNSSFERFVIRITTYIKKALKSENWFVSLCMNVSYVCVLFYRLPNSLANAV